MRRTICLWSAAICPGIGSSTRLCEARLIQMRTPSLNGQCLSPTYFPTQPCLQPCFAFSWRSKITYWIFSWHQIQVYHTWFLITATDCVFNSLFGVQDSYTFFPFSRISPDFAPCLPWEVDIDIKIIEIKGLFPGFILTKFFKYY